MLRSWYENCTKTVRRFYEHYSKTIRKLYELSTKTIRTWRVWYENYTKMIRSSHSYTKTIRKWHEVHEMETKLLFDAKSVPFWPCGAIHTPTMPVGLGEISYLGHNFWWFSRRAMSLSAIVLIFRAPELGFDPKAVRGQYFEIVTRKIRRLLNADIPTSGQVRNLINDRKMIRIGRNRMRMSQIGRFDPCRLI